MPEEHPMRLTDRLPTDVLERARERYLSRRVELVVARSIVVDHLPTTALARAWDRYLTARIERVVARELGTNRMLAARIREDARMRARQYLDADTPSGLRRYAVADYQALAASMARHPAGSGLRAGTGLSVPKLGHAVTVDAPAAPERAPREVELDRRDGAEAITFERHWQITKLGYTAEHDAEHAVSDLVVQALYLLGGAMLANPWVKREGSMYDYSRADLIKAGALIAAAIDRLDREEGR